MNEAKWRTSGDPLSMLAFAGRTGSERKSRLFAVGCCRRIWSLLYDSRSRTAVEVAERYADGGATREELHRSRMDADAASDDAGGDNYEAIDAAADVSTDIRGCVIAAADADYPARAAELLAQANLLRCIFGNPFRPVAVEPDWRTPAVVELARPRLHVVRQLPQGADG